MRSALLLCCLPVRVTLTDRQPDTVIHPTETWETAKLPLTRGDDFRVDERFYVTAKNVAGAASTP